MARPRIMAQARSGQQGRARLLNTDICPLERGCRPVLHGGIEEREQNMYIVRNTRVAFCLDLQLMK
jgi:hypothetical protein